MHAKGKTVIANRNATAAVTSRTSSSDTQAKTVGILTPDAGNRRLLDGASRLTIIFAATVVLVASNPLVTASADSVWHSIADIAKTAEDFVYGIVGKADKRTTVQAGTLDRRLQLPQCTQELEAFQQRGARVASRTVVGVRCNGLNPWKVYVPVDVMVTESVLVARRALPSGHVFAADDVLTEQRDVSRMVSGYLSQAENLVGKRLKHSLMTGRVITPSMLKAHIMIHRGQTVTIVVRNDGLNIHMMGKALMDGSENQRIRVENTNSKRVIEGIVRSSEQVEVLVY
jgi:flagella basal body P-ring formation protein FlgA